MSVVAPPSIRSTSDASSNTHQVGGIRDAILLLDLRMICSVTQPSASIEMMLSLDCHEGPKSQFALADLGTFAWLSPFAARAFGSGVV